MEMYTGRRVEWGQPVRVASCLFEEVMYGQKLEGRSVISPIIKEEGGRIEQ
jgi:hypothetical protein